MTAPTLSLDDVNRRARRAGLQLLCALHPGPDDGAPPGCGTLALLGHAEPGFWTRITDSPEWPGPDPVDRWSQRVIGALAREMDARALFPFGGPPHWPFFSWAVKSGHAWPSPVGLLVTREAGLWTAFRGALAFSGRLPLPPAGRAPCECCRDRPCLTACPAGALTGAGYELGACHAFLDTPAGAVCMDGGCRCRAVCPASRAHGRTPAQSAWHMRHFHPPRERPAP